MTSLDLPLIGQSLDQQLLQFNQLFPAPATTRAITTATLLPPFIPGALIDVVDGATLGVNSYLAKLNLENLEVLIQPYAQMQLLDFIEVFWHGAQAPTPAVVTGFVHVVGQNVRLLIPASRTVEGFGQLYYRVTRAVSTNVSESRQVTVFFKPDLPGGPDREPNNNWHSELAKPGVLATVTPESLNGVFVTIEPYPYQRVNDTIHLSWGGEIIEYTLSLADVGNRVRFAVPAETIEKAGDGLAVPVVYRVFDEVQNISEKWSETSYVSVEISDGLLDAPVVRQAEEGELDLEGLGSAAVLVDVYAPRGLFRAGDKIELIWLGTTAQGVRTQYKPAVQTVTTLGRNYTFEIPNSEATKLAAGSATTAFSVRRSGALINTSLRAEVRFRAVAAKLPAPSVKQAVNGWLDSYLSSAEVVIPVFVGMSLGDRILLTWRGTTASGAIYIHRAVYPISANEVGKPVSVLIGREHIQGLEGRLEVSYDIQDDAATNLLPSAVLTLEVGQLVAQLPAPLVPDAVGGVLDPSAVGSTVLASIAWRNDFTDGDTVTLEWLGASAASSYSNTSVFIFGQATQFRVPKATVLSGEGQVVSVRYLVRSQATGAVRLSQSLALTLGAALPDPLPSLTVPLAEPPDGTRLDPMKVPGGGTIVIAYPTMQPSDAITVYTRQGDVLTLPGNSSGKLEIPVDWRVTASLIGRFVVMGYRVTRAGRVYPSTPLRLEVLPLGQGNLPALVIPQTNGGSVLDLTTFKGDAELTVAPWPFIYLGQTYWIEVTGTDRNDQPVSVQLVRGKAVTAAIMEHGINEALPRASLEQLKLKSQMQVRLRVAFDGDESTGTQSFVPLVVTLASGKGEVIEDISFDDGQFGAWLKTGAAPTVKVDPQGVRYCHFLGSNKIGSGLYRTFGLQAGRYEVRIRASGLGLACYLYVTRQATDYVAVNPQWAEVFTTFEHPGGALRMQIWIPPTSSLYGCGLDFIRITRLT